MQQNGQHDELTRDSIREAIGTGCCIVIYWIATILFPAIAPKGQAGANQKAPANGVLEPPSK